MVYKVGIIGLGRIAHLLEHDPLRGKPCTHAGSWQSLENVSIVAASDIDAEKRAMFSETFPDAIIYSEYKDMLGLDLDFVSVCAYATDRSVMVIDAASSGVKGIWCEKAMACSLQEADDMEAALKQNGSKMIVSYIRRWIPRYQVVKQMINEGVIGSLQTITVHFNGNFLHTGTHAFDLMRYFAGEAESVQAWLDTEQGRNSQSGYRYSGDDCDFDFGGFGIVHFRNGVKGTIHGENKHYFRFEIELLGDKGMIRIGNTQEELWTIAHSDYCTGLKELKQKPFPEVDCSHDWLHAVKNLVNAVEHDVPVECGVRDGRNALAIALALHQSHLHKNSVIQVDDVPLDLHVASR